MVTSNSDTVAPDQATDTDDRPPESIDLAPIGRLDDRLTDATASGIGELLTVYADLGEDGTPDARVLTAAVAGIVVAVEEASRKEDKDA